MEVTFRNYLLLGLCKHINFWMTFQVDRSNCTGLLRVNKNMICIRYIISPSYQWDLRAEKPKQKY